MRIGKHNFIRQGGKGLSLVELVIAMTIMVIIMAAIMPQFRAIRNSWASSEASANMIQNGRVLEEHINRNLSAAKQIVNVSPGSTTNGFIIFKDVADIEKRYMVSGGYVVFGNLGSEEQLAGPVSRFQVSCYSLDNFDTATTDPNTIRLVEVETDFTNSNPLGTNRTFIASAYLQTNANMGCDLVGWWKLDETSGTTAADSSVSGNSGTLVNMSAPSCWGAGQIGNALIFDGTNDHVTLPIGSVINLLTNSTIATWVNWSGSGSSWQHIWDFGTGTTYYMFLTPSNSTNQMRFAITKTGSAGEEQTTYTTALPSGGWHHVAVTIDADNRIHKLYLDGSLVAQKTSANLKPSDLGNTNKNYLARSQYAADPYFNGTLDDVRIYDRILTAAEIAQLANTLRYMGFNEAKVNSDLTSIVVGVPIGTTAGDLLIAAVATDEDTSTTITTAAGWTLIDRGVSSGAVTLGAWYKVAGASESAPTFNWTGGQQAYGWMMRFTGQDAANPINASAVANQTSATPQSPAVTTTVPNCLILRLGAFDDSDVNTLPEPGGNPGLSGHTAITMDASGSSAGTGPVAILGSWTQNAAHAKEAGTNRALVFTAHAMRNGSISLTSVTYGGQAMTKIAEATNGASGRIYTAAFILNDAGISAATGSPPAFALTWSHSPTDSAYSSVFLQNVNQTTMTGATAKNETAVGATITTSALANSAGDMVIEAATSNAAGTYTANNGFTKALEITMGTSNDGMAGYKSATGASETPSVTHTNATVHSLIGFVVKTAGGPGTVSGGAGYVKQSTAGSSGTSNFTLGSSNEARTLTIAIAPDSTNNDGCSGGITP
jgi:type II secretory pathway pseudopilin PulG